MGTCFRGGGHTGTSFSIERESSYGLPGTIVIIIQKKEQKENAIQVQDRIKEVNHKHQKKNPPTEWEKGEDNARHFLRKKYRLLGILSNGQTAFRQQESFQTDPNSERATTSKEGI